jgi:uncharacterized damage-inducible protein DinB
MRRYSLWLTVVALLALTPAAALAQATSAAPAAGTAEDSLALWNSVGRKLIGMAEDWPEDKYDYKPTPEVRSFAEQLLHVAGANYFFTDVARTGKPPAEEDLPRSKYRTKADVVAALKRSFADGAAAIQEKGDAGMSQTVKHPFADRTVRLSALCNYLASHAGEHYGNLVVYYRLNNVVPPASR